MCMGLCSTLFSSVCRVFCRSPSHVLYHPTPAELPCSERLPHSDLSRSWFAISLSFSELDGFFSWSFCVQLRYLPFFISCPYAFWRQSYKWTEYLPASWGSFSGCFIFVWPYHPSADIQNGVINLLINIWSHLISPLLSVAVVQYSWLVKVISANRNKSYACILAD